MAFGVDAVAETLARWGRQGRKMPRGAFEHDGRRHPVVTSRGHVIGDIIPGHGLLLHSDLKALGIKRKIPGVIERSPFMRFLDRLRDERGAITSIFDMQAAYANTHEQISFTVTNMLVNNTGLSIYEQFDAGTGVWPASGTAFNRNTAGAYNAGMTDPPAGKTKYLVGLSTMNFGPAGTGFGMGLIVDALVGIQINGTITTSQTITLPALTRYTSGVGVYLSLWQLRNPGNGWVIATNPTMTFGYTNQAGTGGQSTNFTWTGGGNGESVCPTGNGTDTFNIPLASGDFGVRTVTSYQSSVASSSTSPNGGLLLYAPILFLQAHSETGQSMEKEARSEPERMIVPLQTEAGGTLGCFTLLWLGANSASTATLNFIFDTIWG